MFQFAKKATLATALAASAFATATPAAARDYYDGYRHSGGDTAGAAIAGGIIGLALGAIIASSSNNNHHRDGYYYRDGRYYPYQRGDYYNRDYRREYRGDYRDRGQYYDRDGYRRDYGDYRRGY